VTISPLRYCPQAPEPFSFRIRDLTGVIPAGFLALWLLLPRPSIAQEKPYIVVYDHHLEEPGTLDIEYFSTFGTQKGGNDWVAPWVELEYGVKAWWTTELYLDGQTTFHDSTIFTGFKWENRFRPLRTEHFINPVLYIEYENINEADKTVKEVEGHDVAADFLPPNSVLRKIDVRELELKLILSKDFKGFNVAVNPIFAKNLSAGDPWEFGYAVGVSRPLGLKASVRNCSFCLENFVVGAEMYGGLGDTVSPGLNTTSHYLAPEVAWNLPSDWTIRISTGFGLNHNSHGLLLRWGLSHEISGFGEAMHKLFGGH
jgi:hypothetical protein